MKLTIVAICVLALVLLKYAQADNVEAKPDEGTVIITKHDWLLLKQFIESQKKALADTAKDDQFWQDKYEAAEDCVRENVKNGKMVMTCFNDKEM